MSRILELPDELFVALQLAASAKGLTPPEWIAMQLTPDHDVADERPSHAQAPRTLADLFVDRVGRVRTDIDGSLSEDCGTSFTSR